MVPIIDREIFFGNPELSGGQISPDGQFISFVKPLQGVRNIWVKKRDSDFEEAWPVTADTTRPISGYFWSRDSKYILYVQDKGGDENFHVYAVNPADSAEEDTGVPAARDLTPIDGIRAFIMNVPKSNHNAIHVGINDREAAWHDLYKIDISSGERTLILANDFQYSAVYFDLDDKVKLASRSTPDGGTELLYLKGESFESCYQVLFEESVAPIKFLPDGRLYMATNKGERDLISFVILDLESGEEELIESDPVNEVDFGSAMFSDKTDELIATSYVGDKTRIYWKNTAFEQDYNYLVETLGTDEVSFNSGSEDERLWIVYANSDVDPGAAYLFDRKDRKLTLLYRPRPNLPSEHLCEMQPVRYPSLDGLEIPGYLTIPKGVERKDLPAILFVHGGPWARDYWGYNSYAQFLANRGYVVLQPNFRGSTGFGKQFLNGGNGEWGAKMQDDITAGVQYLVKRGIASKDRIGIMGGSYGGYATLAGLTFTPDIYACGVSIVGPSNLFTLLSSIPPYWETVREMFYLRLGNPTTAEGKQQLKDKSPFFHASNINCPLLVGQGNNDPRVKTAESDQIVTAMVKHDLPVEYLNFPDEGHGFANPNNNMAFLTVCERFLSDHLGGRYQEDIPEPLKEVIDKVSVDVKALASAQSE